LSDEKNTNNAMASLVVGRREEKRKMVIKELKSKKK
jgi:hypothetical protein